MATFVLVHGSWQGAWCWREIVPRLTAKGHEAIAIDLPGRGDDLAAPEKVTLQDCMESIVAAASTVNEKSILVGHSMGGTIRQAAEVIPDRMRALVYLAALVPESGASMMDFASEFDPDYLAQLVWSADLRTATITPEGARNFLYSDCPSSAIDYALPLLRPEPAAPFETPLALSHDFTGRAPRFYVECLRDRIVPIALQRAIATRLAPRSVYSLDTGHAPYFAAPGDLAGILDEIAGETR